MKLRQNLELFMLCILIGIGIVYLRLFASYPANAVNIVKGIWVLINHYIDVLGLEKLGELIGMFSANQMMFMLVLSQIVVGAFLLLIFKENFINGAEILETNLFRVIRWGTVLYLLIVLTMIIFFLSVVGIAFTLILGTFLILVSFISGVSIALFFGKQMQGLLGIRKKNMFILYLLGEFVVAMCTSVGVFSGAVILFMIPVISLGIMWCTFMDKFIYKGTARNNDDESNKFDRDRIRDIITNGVSDY